jgi:hypothetical protein
MEKKNYLILDEEFMQYCKINNITDIESLAKKVFKQGFTILKYGEKPSVSNNISKEQEKIVEHTKNNKDDKSIYDE